MQETDDTRKTRHAGRDDVSLGTNDMKVCVWALVESDEEPSKSRATALFLPMRPACSAFRIFFAVGWTGAE